MEYLHLTGLVALGSNTGSADQSRSRLDHGCLAHSAPADQNRNDRTAHRRSTRSLIERLQPDQPIDRHVRPVRVINVQVRKGIFIDPAEEVALEVLCPGVP